MAEDLETNIETTTPCRGYETRVRVCSATFQAYCEPGQLSGEDGLFVVGVRPRVRAAPGGSEPVVGVEVPVPRRHRRGGQGTRWPTTWRELRARVEAMPGLQVRPGSKHLLVYRGDVQIASMPVHSGDHRALLNLCQELRGVGVDVRR